MQSGAETLHVVGPVTSMSSNHTGGERSPDNGISKRDGENEGGPVDGQVATDGGVDPPRNSDAGERPGRSVAARIGPGGSGTITVNGSEYRFSGGERFDATDAPTPVDHFLGGLAACLSSSVAVQANIRDVEFGEIDITAEATPTRGSIEHISLMVRVDTTAAPDVIERMVVNGERTCHVSELLTEDLEVDVEWEAV